MDGRIDRAQRLCAQTEGVLSLAGGLPADELFPREELATAFVEAVRKPTSGALQYGWPEGNEGRAHGVSFDPGSIFRPSCGADPFAMRLSFSQVPGGEMDEAVARLARTLDALRGEPARRAAC